MSRITYERPWTALPHEMPECPPRGAYILEELTPFTKITEKQLWLVVFYNNHITLAHRRIFSPLSHDEFQSLITIEKRTDHTFFYDFFFENYWDALLYLKKGLAKNHESNQTADRPKHP